MRTVHRTAQRRKTSHGPDWYKVAGLIVAALPGIAKIIEIVIRNWPK